MLSRYTSHDRCVHCVRHKKLKLLIIFYIYENLFDTDKGFLEEEESAIFMYLSSILAASCSDVISRRLTGFSRGCIFAHTFGVAIAFIKIYLIEMKLKLYEHNRTKIGEIGVKDIRFSP